MLSVGLETEEGIWGAGRLGGGVLAARDLAEGVPSTLGAGTLAQPHAAEKGNGAGANIAQRAFSGGSSKVWTQSTSSTRKKRQVDRNVLVVAGLLNLLDKLGGPIMGISIGPGFSDPYDRGPVSPVESGTSVNDSESHSFIGSNSNFGVDNISETDQSSAESDDASGLILKELNIASNDDY